MNSASFDRKVATAGCIGPGGINCACCGPAPGKERKEFFRTGKRRLKAFWKKEIRRQLRDMNEHTIAH